MISLKQVLEYMHSGQPFSCKVVTYDRNRPQKSGSIILVKEAVLMWGENKTPQPGERPPTELEKKLAGIGTDTAAAPGRKPRHADHYTRNIRQLVDGKPTEAVLKIHPALIIEFNGQTTTA